MTDSCNFVTILFIMSLHSFFLNLLLPLVTSVNNLRSKRWKSTRRYPSQKLGTLGEKDFVLYWTIIITLLYSPYILLRTFIDCLSCTSCSVSTMIKISVLNLIRRGFFRRVQGNDKKVSENNLINNI